ncbi:MAG TPA: hypothetical protein VF228_14255 [Iamia sp.]
MPTDDADTETLSPPTGPTESPPLQFRLDPSPYEASVRDSIASIVQFLIEMLGVRLVLHIADRSDPGAAASWASGERKPRQAAEQKLRTAYRAFLTIQFADNEHTARAWFIGLNPQLGDEAPATALREAQLRDVIVAAESFAQTG